jgi:fatty acid desaturase
MSQTQKTIDVIRYLRYAEFVFLIVGLVFLVVAIVLWNIRPWIAASVFFGYAMSLTLYLTTRHVRKCIENKLRDELLKKHNDLWKGPRDANL